MKWLQLGIVEKKHVYKLVSSEQIDYFTSHCHIDAEKNIVFYIYNTFCQGKNHNIRPIYLITITYG